MAGCKTKDEPRYEDIWRLFQGFIRRTAVSGYRANTECGLTFYGEDKVLFASSCPFDPERGPGYIGEATAVLESSDLMPVANDEIFFAITKAMLGIAPR